MENDLLDKIDYAIELVSLELTRVSSDPEHYKNSVNAMRSLTEARESLINERATSNWLRPELIIPVIGVLAEILLVMNHERLHVITTKIWTRIGR